MKIKKPKYYKQITENTNQNHSCKIIQQIEKNYLATILAYYS